MKKLITIFGPGESEPESPLYQDAERLGALLADAGFGIVNGGYEGVMEAVSKGAHSAGGRVIGVTAEVYFARGKAANAFINKEIKVKSAIDRMMELLDLADAFVACGISPGTLSEISIAWDFMEKQFIEKKPCILIGEEWKKLCDILFTQDTYKGKEHFVTFAQSSDEAVEKILAVFGKQMNLPELNIIV